MLRHESEFAFESSNHEWYVETDLIAWGFAKQADPGAWDVHGGETVCCWPAILYVRFTVSLFGWMLVKAAKETRFTDHLLAVNYSTVSPVENEPYALSEWPLNF